MLDHLAGQSQLSYFAQPLVTAATYAGNVLAIPNLLAYWKLDEASGGSAADSSGNGYNGTYQGPTLSNVDGPSGSSGSMGRAPAFDGTNDYVAIHSAGFASAFSATEGALSIWLQVTSSSVWTDGAQRGALSLGVDTSNRVFVHKPTTNNRLTEQFTIAGTSVLNQANVYSSTSWTHCAITWKSTGNIIAYLNGTQVTNPAYSGTFAGTLTDTRTRIGALGTTLFWSGYLAHVAIFTRELTATEITTLATPI